MKGHCLCSTYTQAGAPVAACHHVVVACPVPGVLAHAPAGIVAVLLVHEHNVACRKKVTGLKPRAACMQYACSAAGTKQASERAARRMHAYIT